MWVNIIACILILCVGHACWNYLKNTYSKEKNKDLVKIQTEKYQKIIHEMSGQIDGNDPKPRQDIDEDDLLKQDLEQFMMNQPI